MKFVELAFEIVVFDRMILNLDRKPLLAGNETRAAGHRPALHYPVEFEPQIVMEPPRRMLLDDEGERGAGLLMRGRDARRLRRFAEIPFASVFFERHAAQPCSEAD